MNKPLALGKPVPLFSASSTQGLINLKDYAGKWIILLCNPTEFNTWRRNEYIQLLKQSKAFYDKEIELIPISADPHGGHLQWYYNNVRVGTNIHLFPIVDDRNGKVRELYHLEASNARESSGMQAFVIAPDQCLMDKVNYPVFGAAQINELLVKVNNFRTNYRPEIHSIENQPGGTNPLCSVNPIVGEYVLGNPKNVDAHLLDFVIYAFALINPNGTLTAYSTLYLRQLANLRLENPYLKVILGIGGWGADGFSDAALTPTSRYAFAREVKRWVDEYQLDGVDIDWEYPGSSAAGITSRPQDRENFTLLLTALRDVLGADAWISVAGTGETSYINNVEIANIAPIINYFNLMAYDFTAGETGATAGRHQSNLYPSELGLGNNSVNSQVQNLINAGMPSSQILMGIPFYGRYGATQTKTYDELRKNYLNQNGYRVLWDNVAKAPYIVDADGNFAYSYDNLLSIYFKGLYIAENCLGGMFAWQAGMDQANILTNGMSQAIRDIQQLENVLAQAYYLAEDQDDDND